MAAQLLVVRCRSSSENLQSRAVRPARNRPGGGVQGHGQAFWIVMGHGLGCSEFAQALQVPTGASCSHNGLMQPISTVQEFPSRVAAVSKNCWASFRFGKAKARSDAKDRNHDPDGAAIAVRITAGRPESSLPSATHAPAEAVAIRMRADRVQSSTVVSAAIHDSVFRQRQVRFA